LTDEGVLTGINKFIRRCPVTADRESHRRAYRQQQALAPIAHFHRRYPEQVRENCISTESSSERDENLASHSRSQKSDADKRGFVVNDEFESHGNFYSSL
jgi:hypothetical protein